MSDNKNVLGEKLETCGTEPLTGYFRDGSCASDESDIGSHTVCAKVTKEFWNFQSQWVMILQLQGLNSVLMDSKRRFMVFVCKPMVRGVSKWRCSKVKLKSTNMKSLEVIDIDVLKSYAIDLS